MLTFLGHHTTTLSRSGLDGIYLVVATLTTVGFGDVAPTGDTARAMAIIIVPMGT